MGVRLLRGLMLVVLALGVALAGRAAIYRSMPEEEPDPYEPADSELIAWENDIHRGVILAQGQQILPLHRKKTEPQPGDWLSRHQEPGQTFSEYGRANPNRPSTRRTTIYIRPWGEFSDTQYQVIQETAEFLERFYEVPVKILDRWDLKNVPAYARPRHPDRDDERLMTPYALDLLQRKRPKDALAVLALTTVDLTPRQGRSWVFGQASSLARVGVWSLFRQGNLQTERTQVLRRTLMTAVHETGHMLGILHCIAYECGMNGVSSREEADTRPLAFCPECEMKVWWACSLAPAARYERLAEFARRHRLEQDEKFWRESIIALKSHPARAGRVNALAPKGDEGSRKRAGNPQSS